MSGERAVCSAESESRLQLNVERFTAVDVHDARLLEERRDVVREHPLVAAEQVLVQRAWFARAVHAADADATAATQKTADTRNAFP